MSGFFFILHSILAPLLLASHFQCRHFRLYPPWLALSLNKNRQNDRTNNRRTARKQKKRKSKREKKIKNERTTNSKKYTRKTLTVNKTYRNEWTKRMNNAREWNIYVFTTDDEDSNAWLCPGFVCFGLPFATRNDKVRDGTVLSLSDLNTCSAHACIWFVFRSVYTLFFDDEK